MSTLSSLARMAVTGHHERARTMSDGGGNDISADELANGPGPASAANGGGDRGSAGAEPGASESASPVGNAKTPRKRARRERTVVAEVTLASPGAPPPEFDFNVIKPEDIARSVVDWIKRTQVECPLEGVPDVPEKAFEGLVYPALYLISDDLCALMSRKRKVTKATAYGVGLSMTASTVARRYIYKARKKAAMQAEVAARAKTPPWWKGCRISALCNLDCKVGPHDGPCVKQTAP